MDTVGEIFRDTANSLKAPPKLEGSETSISRLKPLMNKGFKGVNFRPTQSH